MERGELQAEVLKVILPVYRGTAALTMRSGKTKLALLYLDHFYEQGVRRFLISVPKLAIIDDAWKANAQEYGLTHIVECCEFTTYVSLPKQSLDYDILVLDEVHSLTEACEDYLKAFKGRILGLTGTPPKYEHSVKGRLIKEFCPVVYTYTTSEGVTDRITNDYRIVVHAVDLSTRKDLRIVTRTGSFMTSEKLNYEYWSRRIAEATNGKEEQIMRIMRMKAMMGFQSKEAVALSLFNETTDKSLIFCNTQEQSDRMCMHSYHSDNPLSALNLDMFKSGAITKLSAVLQLSEGITIPNLKEIFILHSYSGGSPKTSQRIGRCLSLSPDEISTVHMFVFRGTKDVEWIQDSLSDFNNITWPQSLYESNR